MSIQTTRIQLRRGTSQALAAVNEVLLAGEICIETDTGKYKIGDGSTAWSSLEYAGGEAATSTEDNVLNYNNAGTHNSIYLEGSLGNSLTAEQSAAIRAGTFENIYVGKSWTFTDVPYTYTDENNATQSSTYSGTMRVADCDYYLNCGDTALTAHHVVVVPDESLFSAKMNDTSTTEGGYVGSKMYTTYLRRAEAIFKACFGEDHVLSHREYLVNAVSNGRPSGGTWYTRLVDLMDERMVYGSLIYDSGGSDGSTISNRYSVSQKQLNLFRHRPDLIGIRVMYWLRNVVSGAYFAGVSYRGYCSYGSAYNSYGVRPAALIY